MPYRRFMPNRVLAAALPVAMPSVTAVVLAVLLTALMANSAHAQAPSPAPPPSTPASAASAPPDAAAASSPDAAASAPVDNSALNTPLFYELLVGEMEARSGELSPAYQLLLDAAKRTNDEQLYRRATEIALQGRAGEQALAAVKAWRQGAPASLDALRLQSELLIQLDRLPDAVEPLQTLLKLSSPPQRLALINSMPRFFARSSDRKLAANVIEQTLLPYINEPETRVAARVAVGRGWLLAINGTKALALAQSAHEMDRAAEAPAGLALEMLPGTPEAEAIVKDQLAAKPDSTAVRLLYVRALLNGQRVQDATSQLDTLTRQSPELPQAWLTLGALHVQLHEPADAIVALKKYIALVEAGALPAPAEGAADTAAANTDDDAAPPSTKEDALIRGYLLLSQAADMQGDLKGADAWLAKIDSPQRALEVQVRRASLLARAGKVTQARALIRRLPETTPEEARQKLLAEAQVLRDAKLWAEANNVLGQANQRFPNDVELIYEQSMMFEKLNKLADMERLLRRVIELKPDHQHAYNALGYSLADRNQRLPEAHDLIQKALELSPGEPSITDSMGWVEYRMGHRDESIRLLREAYQGQPDAEIAAHLGEVLWVNGQTDEARRVLREARQRDATNEVLRETLTRLRINL